MSDEQRAREIDYAVAVHVMGQRSLTERSKARGVRWSGPHYSTTWEGMGLVVEKHLADGGFVDMESDGPRIEWTVVFQDSAGRPFGRATAATAPLACALAALRAKGVDVAALVGGET